MNKPQIIVGAILLSAITVAPASAYQFDTNLSYHDSSIDFDETLRNDRDVSMSTLSGTYYFSEVNDTKGPLALAAFIDRSSYVNGGFSVGELDFSYRDYDTNSVGVAGSYIDAQSGWLAGGRIRRTSVDFDRSVDTMNYGAHVGKYIANNTSVVVNLSRSSTDNGYGTSHGNSLHATVRHLGALASLGSEAHYYVSARFGLRDASDNDDAGVLAVGATYFPNNNLGFGVGFEHSNGDYTDRNTVEIKAQWFVSRDLSFALTYQCETFDNNGPSTFDDVGVAAIDSDNILRGTPDGDRKGFTIQGSYRF